MAGEKKMLIIDSKESNEKCNEKRREDEKLQWESNVDQMRNLK